MWLSYLRSICPCSCATENFSSFFLGREMRRERHVRYKIELTTFYGFWVGVRVRTCTFKA